MAQNKDAAKVLFAVLNAVDNDTGRYSPVTRLVKAYRMRHEVRNYYQRISRDPTSDTTPGPTRYNQLFRAMKILEKVGIDVRT